MSWSTSVWDGWPAMPTGSPYVEPEERKAYTVSFVPGERRELTIAGKRLRSKETLLEFLRRKKR